MKLFLGRRRKAGGPGLARHRFNPMGESLEGRQLLAAPIEFNPTGNGNPADTYAVGSFGWAVGNSLAVSALPLSVGETYQLDYQATLANLIDPNSNSFVPPGLNSTYQITAVASVTEVVTSLTPDGSVATFALAPTQSPNSFFEIYYNSALVASDLAGTGFNVGTLILSASPDPTLANSGNFALALNGSGSPIIEPFDQFDPVNYPGILSVTGTGSATLDGDVSSFDPAFFETNLAQISFDTSNTTPFLETDPSMLFVGSPGAGAPNVTPNIGTINVVNGTDFQFQADANSSFTSAAPTVTTTPSPTSATLGTTPLTLFDSAVLSGGFSPTGTITFTLVAPGGGTVDTETVTVNGDGTYTTPTGYTLPTTAAVTGTYQWNASYTSGNGNNNDASDVDATDEQVPVSPASPAIATTPSPTSATLGTTTVTLLDSAVLSGGYFPTGTITFSLVAPGGATVDTETVTVDGNGTYTTPTGYTLPTTGTVTGTYQWNASYASGNGNNNDSSDVGATDEQVPVIPAIPGSPALVTTPNPTSATLGTTTVTLFDSAVLSGGNFPIGTITFSLVAPGGATVDTETVPVSGNGTYTTPTGYTLTPGTATATGTYQWDATYTSGNGNNTSASDVNSSNERVNVCPTVVNVVRYGVHEQPMHIVVTFSAQVTSAQAENINNYHLYKRGPDGKFNVPVRVKSAVYDPATNSVTLSFAHSYNVHYFAEITVTNPCPGCPSFSGILNKKYILGDIDDHGRIIVLPKTDIPGVLNPSVLPKVFTPANRHLVLRLSKKPQSGAFYNGNTDLAQPASRRTSSPADREGRDRRLIRIVSRSGSGAAASR
jgi:hypothetical protein